MSRYQFPWEDFTEAAKTGFSGRLIAYGAGMDIDYRYTTHQDYVAGELSGLHQWTGPPLALPCPVVSAGQPGESECLYKAVERMHTAPRSQVVDGLLWHGWTCLDDRNWVQTRPDTDCAGLRYSDLEVLEYLRRCRRHRVPMTFNVSIFQDGTASQEAVAQLRRVGAELSRIGVQG